MTDVFLEEETKSAKREAAIARYMEKMGLPYEMRFTGNMYGALASSGSQICVMAQTYHEDTLVSNQYFVGYYPTVMEARDVQQRILNAKPRKRFVQSVIIANAS